MSRAFSSIKRTLLAAAGVVAGMALGAEGQLSMGMAEAWTWVEVPGVTWSAWETRVESAPEGMRLLLHVLDEEEDDEEVITLASLDVKCHDVEAFYGVLDLTDGSALQEPSLQTGTDTSVFFVHGYNVDRSAAEVWFQEIFKRLWQSGMNARFYGVTWDGDAWESISDASLLQPIKLPNYYVNVENAFASAEPFAEALRKTTGRKVVMAHSLGNMVVSSAIQDHGALVDVYFMLNSAVPAEAYDTDVPTCDFTTKDVPEGLIHVDWRDYPPKSYAALWYRHFLPHEGFVPID